jgi:hypothetical protein
VFNKIQHLEHTFRDAYIFVKKETGVGMLSSDRGTFNDIVTSKWKHYFDLEAVLGGRSGNVPKAMSYESMESDYESNDNTKNTAYKSDKINGEELENDNDDEDENRNNHNNVNNGNTNTGYANNDDDDNDDYIDNNNDDTNESDHEIMVTPQVPKKRSKQTPITTIAKPNKKKKMELMP